MTPEIPEQNLDFFQPYLSDPQFLGIGSSVMNYDRYPIWDNQANVFLLKNEKKGGNTFFELKSRFKNWAGQLFCVAWNGKDLEGLNFCLFPFMLGYAMADIHTVQASMNLGNITASAIQIQLPKTQLPLNILDNPNVLNLLPDSIKRIRSIRPKSSTLLLPGQMVNPWEVFLDQNRYRISPFISRTISEKLWELQESPQ